MPDPKRPGRPRKNPDQAPMPAPLEFHWTLMQIAVAHQFTTAALKAQIKAKVLRARKCGKEWRVPDSWYREWLAKSTPRVALKEVA